MKNLILDEPIRDSFIDFLDKGETISWVGEPNIKSDSKRNKIIENIVFILFAIAILSEAFLGESIQWEKIVMLLLITFLIFFIRKIWKNDVDQIQYAITSKNIIFKLTKNDFHKIPITSILKVRVIRNENYLPSIELVVREKDRFGTYILHDNGKRLMRKRKMPTLEHIENTEDVIQLIDNLIDPDD